MVLCAYMTLELREFAKRLEKDGYESGANLLRASAGSWQKEGLIPKKLSPRKDEEKINDHLSAEWEGQVKKYIRLGFHKELNLSKEEYRDSLSKFTLQPENYKGRFDIPVLVETRIPVNRQAKLAGLYYYLDGLEVRDWEYDPKGYKTPETPYVTWMQDGRNYCSSAVKNFRQNIAEDERGATEFDGVALFIKNPKVLQHHSIDLPGTSVGSDGAAYLSLWLVGPGLYAFHVGLAGPFFGSASCGR